MYAACQPLLRKIEPEPLGRREHMPQQPLYASKQSIVRTAIRKTRTQNGNIDKSPTTGTFRQHLPPKPRQTPNIESRTHKRSRIVQQFLT